ncbi:hypothetical protein [Dongia mobilis]|uniref:hypothetical protein n=1 Tax=Dongia sp. TaxID=1977262 RepID=UPI0026EF9D91
MVLVAGAASDVAVVEVVLLAAELACSSFFSSPQATRTSIELASNATFNVGLNIVFSF